MFKIGYLPLTKQNWTNDSRDDRAPRRDGPRAAQDRASSGMVGDKGRGLISSMDPAHA